MTKTQIDLSESVTFTADYSPTGQSILVIAKKDLLKAVIPVLEEIAKQEVDVTNRGLVTTVGHLYAGFGFINYLKELTNEKNTY